LDSDIVATAQGQRPVLAGEAWGIALMPSLIWIKLPLVF
jgi:hypothetical protein